VRAGLLLLPVLLAFAIAGSSAASPLRTEVVRWSPFDASGRIKPGLDVQQLGKGECVGRSLTVGAPGLRCKAGRWVLDPCWRAGDGVVCAGFPWDETVSTIRVPRSTFSRPASRVEPVRPWAIELAGGNRCRLLQSSHTTVALRGRQVPVEYSCDDGLVLLRSLTRGRVWRVVAARWEDGRYEVLPDTVVRRAYFGATAQGVSLR
jgi:hypothetical protein